MSIFTIYTKTLSPVQSPLQSPVLGPIPMPNLDKVDQLDNAKDKDNVNKDKYKDKDNDKDKNKGTYVEVGGVAFFGSMLLCDCCNQRCSNKPKSLSASSINPDPDPDPDFALEQYANRITHATHYTYNASTPRLVGDFDNNINININNPISVFLDI